MVNKKRGHVARDNARNTPRIGASATRPVDDQGTNHLYPSFRFSHTDHNNYCLHNLTTTEIEELVVVLGRMEQMTWLQVLQSGGHGRSSGGLGYNAVDREDLRAHVPDHVPTDVRLCKFRVGLSMRVYGYRAGSIFYLLWFDGGDGHNIQPG